MNNFNFLFLNFHWNPKRFRMRQVWLRVPCWNVVARSRFGTSLLLCCAGPRYPLQFRQNWFQMCRFTDDTMTPGWLNYQYTGLVLRMDQLSCLNHTTKKITHLGEQINTYLEENNVMNKCHAYRSLRGLSGPGKKKVLLTLGDWLLAH